jgi:hypothetical protein
VRQTSAATSIAAATCAALAALGAQAQTRAPQQPVRPAIANHWIDLATSTFAGMPEMPGGLSVGGMLGGGGAQGDSAFGATRSMQPGRWADIAHFTRNRPQGTEATQSIPPGMQLGASLALVPPARARVEPGRDGQDPDTMERPKGRLMLYWGCGEQVRAGQPRVLDFSKASPQEWGSFWQGRYGAERGATARDGNSLWPNERDRRRLAREATVAGEHAVSGEGVPPGLRFQIPPANDLMPAIELSQRGQLAGPVQLGWQPVANARAYFLNAMGSRGSDMIFWSSAEAPDAGFGLLEYLSPANIERWTGDKVLLPASQTSCAVPSGIFAGTEGAMLRMIAHGPELNLVHPPRPADPKATWEQEWTVRVRTKSQTMAMLGDDERSARRAPAERSAPAASQPQGDAPAAEKKPEPRIPGLPGATEVLRGIFGR